MDGFIKGFEITQNKLAVPIVSRRRINEIVHGKRGITADTAPAARQVRRTSPEFWMNLQAHFESPGSDGGSGLPRAARLRGDEGNRRLHQRWIKFIDRKKRSTTADVAIARELAGWCWSLAALDAPAETPSPMAT